MKRYRDVDDPKAFDDSKVGQLIDKISTCELPKEGEDMREIVQQVQVHRHKKQSCFKKSNKCRFNFPRFPCRETLIVKPFSEDPDDLEGTKARKDKCEKIIERVKTALENVDDENITFDEFLMHYII